MYRSILILDCTSLEGLNPWRLYVFKNIKSIQYKIICVSLNLEIGNRLKHYVVYFIHSCSKLNSRNGVDITKYNIDFNDKFNCVFSYLELKRYNLFLFSTRRYFLVMIWMACFDAVR